MDELIHHAIIDINNPAVQRMIDLYFNNENELRELQDSYDSLNQEYDDLESEFRDRSDQLDEAREMINDLIEQDIQGKLEQVLEKLEV